MPSRVVLAFGVAIVLVASGPAQPARSSGLKSTAAGDWPTYHGDNTRQGYAPVGPALGGAHRLWTTDVDGSVYAEPLIVAGKVIVATENDTVYAFSAANGAQAWSAHLGEPVSGGSLPCGNIDPSGITSTPVVDPKAGVVYAVIFVRGPRHFLVALNLADGKVQWRRSVDAPGADPSVHQERAAVTLSHGRVYVAYGGLYGDCGNYHGRVVGVSVRNPSGPLVSYRVPTAREGGIWAASGPAVDGSGNLYVATGNGSASTFDYGNAVIRLTPSLRKRSFFAPKNAGSLNDSDTDLGSTGPLLLPRARIFAIGKSGVGYLLSANRLGGIGHSLASRSICDSAFGGLAYKGGVIYIPCSNGLTAVRARALSTVWHNGSADQPPIVAGAGVWAVGNGTLYQFDARNGHVRFHASIGDTAHFATPASSGRRIFVAADRRVLAFG